MKNILIIALCLLTIPGLAQKKKKQDREAIKSMCGCYEISFNFAETFSPNKEYKFHDNYISGGLEWVELVEDEKNKISMQHLLIVAPKTIVKHWRQDWLFENTSLYAFDGNRTWKHMELSQADVKGQWTQKVYQVDDGLRYEGSASWIHVDGKHFWEATSDSPLPRREFSKRSDYNVMTRVNRHELTDYGWVHEQDNDKVLRADGNDDVLIAQEKGYNTYTKVPDEKCKDAQDWWTKNQHYWSDVRKVWDDIYAAKSTLAFKGKVDDKIMFQKLFALGDEVVASVETYNSEAVQKQVADIISAYRVTAPAGSVSQ